MRGRKGVGRVAWWKRQVVGWTDGWTECSVLVIVRAWRGDRQKHR